jgi:competence protein ComEC
MKLPAVAIAAAFACGIALGLYPAIGRNGSSKPLLFFLFCVVTFFLAAGFLLLRLGRVLAAAGSSLLCWLALGTLSASLTQQPLHPNHVIALAETGALPMHTPLRWHGRLRDEPSRLPWGDGYEIAISGVEYGGALHDAEGGLRLSFSPGPGIAKLPELHAGDEVAVLTGAQRPPVFRDEGAFDRREYLRQQDIDLVATLRSSALLQKTADGRPSVGNLLARMRGRLRDELDRPFAGKPQIAGVLRAMLLGDRSFVDRAEAQDFQKTGVFHVLVVAGLHVGAVAFAIFWLGRRLLLSRGATILLTLAILAAYLAVAEERTPMLRAALMTAMVVFAGYFYRRLELLNSAAIAALILLVTKPQSLAESSFQLTFVAIGCIAGLAVPWLEKTVQIYARAMRGWRDITRDSSQEARAAQFRIDLRSSAKWIAERLPWQVGAPVAGALAECLALTFRVWELLVVALVLQVGMLPLMARDFHRVPLSAPLVNLAAVPLLGVIVPLGFLTLVTGLVAPPVGRLFVVPLSVLTGLLVRIVEWFAHFPSGSYRIPGPPLWLIFFFFVLAIGIAVEFRLSQSRRTWLLRTLCLALAGCAVVIAAYPFAPTWSKNKLELTVLDVGQGDSLLVVTPSGKTLLIDGGGAFAGFNGREEHNGIDPGEEAVSPYLWSRGFKRIDAVALTHAHQDHLGGLFAILDNFHVGALWVGHEVSAPALAKLEELARIRKIPVKHEYRGKSFHWDGVDGEFLWPPQGDGNTLNPAQNNDSLVLRLHYRDISLLLPGDAEHQVEKEIVSENETGTLHSEVLKIGHHGSKNSTTAEFLNAVHPQFGIISNGENNPYGHPSPELLERLQSAGLQVFRTDRDGAIHVLTDGNHIEIRCFLDCSGRAGESLAMQRMEKP